MSGAVSAFFFSLLAAGCTTTATPTSAVTQLLERIRPATLANYGPQTNEKFPVAAIDTSRILILIVAPQIEEKGGEPQFKRIIITA